MGLDDSPSNAVTAVNLRAIPAILVLVTAVGYVVESHHRCITDLVHLGIEEFVSSDPNLTSDSLVVSRQFFKAIEALLEEGIEVHHLRSGNLKKSGGITLAPTVERSALKGEDLRGRVSFTLVADRICRHRFSFRGATPEAAPSGLLRIRPLGETRLRKQESLNLDVGPSQLGPADSIGPVHQERKPSLHSTFGFRDRLVGDDCRVRAQAGFGRRRTLTVSVPRRQKRFDHALASCRHRLRRFDKRNNGYAVLWT